MVKHDKRKPLQAVGPEGFTTSQAFNPDPSQQKARDVARQDPHTQLRAMHASLKKNLDRVAGLVQRGDYYQAAMVAQKFVVPVWGTARALVDKVNALGEGEVHMPLLSTHIPPKVLVKRKTHARWSKF
jgi:hypothetical protein